MPIDKPETTRGTGAGLSDFVTVATAADGKLMTKVFSVDSEGREQTLSYDKGYRFNFSTPAVACLQDLAQVLDGLDRYSCVIYGRLIEGTLTPCRRLLNADKETGDPAAIEDAAHYWLLLDIDKLAIDGGVFDPVAEPERAVEYIRVRLPSEFHGARCLWRLTSSAGVPKPLKEGELDKGPTISMRLGFWLDRAITGAEAKAWLTGTGAIADCSIYTPNQPIYAATPIFKDGRVDPVARRSGIVEGRAATVMPGEIGPRAVKVPVDLKPKVKAAPRAAPEGVVFDTEAAIAAGRDCVERTISTAEWKDGPTPTPTGARAYRLATRLKDEALSPERIVDLLVEMVPWFDEEDRPQLEEMVENAFLHGQNDPGCGPPISAACLFGEIVDQGEATERLRDEAPPLPGPPVLSYGTPLVSAREFVKRCYTDRTTGNPTLIRYRGDFYAWTGTHYRPKGDDEMTAHLYQFLETAVVRVKEGANWTTRPFAPDQTRVNKVRHALPGCGIVVSDGCDAPAFLRDSLGSFFDKKAQEVIPCQNGLLLPDFGSLLLPHEPSLLSFNTLSFDYDPNAPEPVEWLKFLASLWPDDAEAIATLQDIFGYLVSGRTHLHKMFLLLGPKRSGKGTILRIMGALLGAENVCYSQLENLKDTFGLEPLIGKMAMLVGDSRMDTYGRGQGAIVENLLSITGEDGRSINRKFKPAWQGRLGVRIVAASNEAPRFNDASGTIAHRIIPLRMRISFANREDHGLTERLASELPGIFNWALAGLRRLSARGDFVIPQSAQDTVEAIEASASPMLSFVEARCVVGARELVECGQLYRTWTSWCLLNGHKPGSDAEFGRKLRAAVPSVERTRRGRSGEYRPWFYEGVGLRPAVSETPADVLDVLAMS